MELIVKLKQPHKKQASFIDSKAKRKVVRAGRRGGKTTGVAIYSVEQFLKGKRVLYGTPTSDQIERFWFEVTNALAEPIKAGLYYKNETKHIIELSGTEQRIKAKTCWNANGLRGDYGDVLILDEYQDMDSDVWELVGAPMLLDNDGDAVFIYTSKIGLQHVKALTEKCKNDTTGKWELFTFSSFDNPHISKDALDSISEDMTDLSYRLEILAEDIEDDPNALWNRDIIRHITKAPELYKIVVAVDPPGGKTECGIIVAGVAKQNNEDNLYVLADKSLTGSPEKWASEVITAYHTFNADEVIAEINFGGDMVAYTLGTIDKNVPVTVIHASRGKSVRAQPIVALYEKKKAWHVGAFPGVEDEMCNWVQGESNYSPNRLDSLVWAGYDLIISKKESALEVGVSPMAGYRG